MHPVFFGSALTGAGVEELMGGIAELLPARSGDGDGPLRRESSRSSAARPATGSPTSRVFSGTVRMRDRHFDRHGEEGDRAPGLRGGDAVQRDGSHAGEIAKLWGLAEVQIGD